MNLNPERCGMFNQDQLKQITVLINEIIGPDHNFFLVMYDEDTHTQFIGRGCRGCTSLIFEEIKDQIFNQPHNHGTVQ